MLVFDFKRWFSIYILDASLTTYGKWRLWQFLNQCIKAECGGIKTAKTPISPTCEILPRSNASSRRQNLYSSNTKIFHKHNGSSTTPSLPFTIWYSSYCLSHKDGYSAVASACERTQANCLACSGFAFRRRCASSAARTPYRQRWMNWTNTWSTRSDCPSRHRRPRSHHRVGPDDVRWIPRPGRASAVETVDYYCCPRTSGVGRNLRSCYFPLMNGDDAGGDVKSGVLIWMIANGYRRIGCSSSWSGVASPGSLPRSGPLS